MKKLFLNFMFAASLLFSAGVSFVSCTDDEGPDNGDQDTPLLEGEVIKGNDTPTPIKCYEGDETVLSEYGVQIVKGVTLDNEIRFECIPGASAKSYRLDIIPLAKAYDMIYTANYDEINNGKVMTVEETAQALKDLLFAEGGAAGYTFAPSDKMTDYATGHEFNWVADGYSQFTIVPDAEYLIVAVGCSDENGANGRDMSILCVETTPKDLIGDPIVKVKGEVKRGWSAFGFDMEANADAKYYYLFPIGTKDMNNYVDKYGEKTFVDMIRFSQYPSDATKGNLSAQYPLWLDPSEEITIITIGADENYVVNDMEKTSFYMPQKPADRVMPKKGMSRVTWNQELTSASVVNFNIEFDKEISLIRYKLMSKSEWEDMANDPEAQAKLADELTYNGGWVEKNPNYKLNVIGEDDYEVAGEAGTTTSKQYIIPAGSENYLVWTCQNGFEDYNKELEACYFKTDEWSRDLWGWDEDNLWCTFESTTRGITLLVEPTDNTAFYYHRMIPEDRNFELGTDEQIHAAFDFMFEEDGAYYNFTDPWAYEKGTPEWKEQNSFPYMGLEPGKKYDIMVIGETWDGKLLFPQIVYAETEANEGGLDPQMTITDAKYGFDPLWGYNTFSVTYKPIKDVRMYYHGIFDRNKADMKSTYADEVTYWKEIIVNGEDGTGNPFQSDREKNQFAAINEWSTSDYKLAMCLPYGKGDVKGELSMVAFDVKELRVITDLSEIWPDYEPASAATASVATKPVSANLFTATERIKKNQEEAEAFLQSLRKIRGFDKYQWTPSIKAPAPISINGEPVVK